MTNSIKGILAPTDFSIAGRIYDLLIEKDSCEFWNLKRL